MTHTYAILEVSQAVFDEVKHRLTQADYHHAFGTDDGEPIVDMHGIALKAGPKHLSVRDVAIVHLREAIEDYERRHAPDMKLIYQAAKDVVES